MKIKGMKWWVAFCDTMILLVCVPIMLVCYAGLFPWLLAINKRDTGEFAVKRTLTAMGIVISDVKDAFVTAIEGMDELYEK